METVERFGQVCVCQDCKDAHNELTHDYGRLLIKYTQLKQHLREIEWSAEAYDTGYCPVCGAWHENGHIPDCWLAQAIKE